MKRIKIADEHLDAVALMASMPLTEAALTLLAAVAWVLIPPRWLPEIVIGLTMAFPLAIFVIRDHVAARLRRHSDSAEKR